MDDRRLTIAHPMRRGCEGRSARVQPAGCPPDPHPPSSFINRHSSIAFSAAGAAAPAVDQSAAALARDIVHDDEIIILMLRPSLWFVVLSCSGSLMVIAILTLALMWMSRLPWVGWNDGQVFAAGAAAGALRLLWQGLEWWSRVYVLTDRRVIRRAGVLRVAVFQAPLRNIQHTAVVRRLREQLFGLGSIGFATAGSDTFDAWWVMLRDSFAVHRTIVEAVQRYGR
jgi:hypothetical protein